MHKNFTLYFRWAVVRSTFRAMFAFRQAAKVRRKGTTVITYYTIIVIILLDLHMNT